MALRFVRMIGYPISLSIMISMRFSCNVREFVLIAA